MMTPMPSKLTGYVRQDGRKGIRNYLLVVYLVECAHHVAREIAYPYRQEGAHVMGFSGCYFNAHADKVMQALCTHPNCGAVLLVSLGCESFKREALRQAIAASGRPVSLLVIQQEGGTRSTIEAGQAWVASTLAQLAQQARSPMDWSELVVGTICGGSDATSGITANPAIGRAFDQLVAQGAACLFEETGELIGCENIMAARAITPALGAELRRCVDKARHYYATLGYDSFATGNAEGGLSTIEEKSMGAYSKSGDAPISGILKPGDRPPQGGLYLLDVVPDGEVRYGFPNINDNAEISELIACGAHLILFSTGRGSVVGSALAPVIKICANPHTYARLREDMDIDAGCILLGQASLDEVGTAIVAQITEVAQGQLSASEALGHQEFVLSYKQFEPLGPACLPAR